MNENTDYKIKSIKLGLDRLTLTVSPFNMAPYPNFPKELKSLAKFDDDITFAAPTAQAGYRVAVRLKISSVSADIWPLLQADPYGKNSYFRLECNPNRLGPEGISEMKNIIDNSTPHGWPLFTHSARASRIDVNIDAHGLPLGPILVRTPYPRYTEVWSQKGELELVGIGEPQTIYLGQKSKSKNLYRIYRLGPGKVEVGCTDATRFESVDGSTRPLLAQLHNYASPFGKLIVQSVFAPKPSDWADAHWRMLIRIACDHGLNVALKHLPKDERKQAEKALAAVPIADFDLKQAWSQWPSLLATLDFMKPGCGGTFLPGYCQPKAAA
ncbi:MAG TPA: hypothetical protein VGT78_08990 [Rhizomicrobium sp.]|nr:hypothetical protein [Rhizomicrobium sp.]